MLNLSVLLMKLRFLVPLALLLIAAQTTPPIAITYPLTGDVLHGQVTITGTTQMDNFVSAQLEFSYASDPQNPDALSGPGNWFTLQTFTQPMLDSALAVWDTTSITDGDYVLRLQVSLGDGTTQEVTVPIKVQNDTPFFTSTPKPTATFDSVVVQQIPTSFLLAASPTPTETPRPTPMPFPTNSAALNQNAIYSSLGRGALVIIGLFIFAGLIIRVRRL
jgi:hypothetical protein